MSERSTEQLIADLASDAQAAKPLPAPWRRALITLAAIAVVGFVAIVLMADPSTLRARYAGREDMMALEMAAALATGALALTAAFFLAIPGRSRRWMLSPLLPFIAWISLSGMGCYRDLLGGATGAASGDGVDCLIFIVGASLVLGIPVLWLLARARPLEPLPVAAMAGLGVAALAAFLLQFFHPFTVTFLDLGMHLIAVLIVIGAAAMLNRRTLAPA